MQDTGRPALVDSDKIKNLESLPSQFFSNSHVSLCSNHFTGIFSFQDASLCHPVYMCNYWGVSIISDANHLAIKDTRPVEPSICSAKTLNFKLNYFWAFAKMVSSSIFLSLVVGIPFTSTWRVTPSSIILSATEETCTVLFISPNLPKITLEPSFCLKTYPPSSQ